ncbi:MAG: hypothetical protein KKB51_16005 [Candidatus Riflebacteria bacterium]|nr:hypothetical protein [Candidatus Riflebacteria bacterium]
MQTKQANRRTIITVGLLLALLAATSLTGCLDFFGTQARKRDEKLKKRDELKNKIARNAALFDQRDRLQAEIKSLDAQIKVLQSSQGAMLETTGE